ncbi:hypothetical protein I4U23_027733 [Adineta vaga]|nr:hypothetical protein I4U23_027733 [Adineta vaga]
MHPFLQIFVHHQWNQIIKRIKHVQVQLKIDLMNGILNGSFITKPQLPYYFDNRLDVRTQFPLTDSSVVIDIDYRCTMSDYCDIDFVREALLSSWNVSSVKSIHETLVNRLYEPTSTGPVQCSNGNSCPQNTTSCLGVYLRTNPTQTNPNHIDSECQDRSDFFEINWDQTFLPNNQQQSQDTGALFCNKPHCASNASIIETFQWLSREYILPLNISVLDLTTTTTTTTTISTTTTTTSIPTTKPNNASTVFQVFNYFLSFFIAISVLQHSFLHM